MLKVPRLVSRGILQPLGLPLTSHPFPGAGQPHPGAVQAEPSFRNSDCSLLASISEEGSMSWHGLY